MAVTNTECMTEYPVCRDITKVTSLLKEYGVCVIPDVFTDDECNSWMTDILTSMEILSGGKVNHLKPDSWKGELNFILPFLV